MNRFYYRHVCLVLPWKQKPSSDHRVQKLNLDTIHVKPYYISSPLASMKTKNLSMISDLIFNRNALITDTNGLPIVDIMALYSFKKTLTFALSRKSSLERVWQRADEWCQFIENSYFHVDSSVLLGAVNHHKPSAFMQGDCIRSCKTLTSLFRTHIYRLYSQVSWW